MYKQYSIVRKVYANGELMYTEQVCPGVWDDLELCEIHQKANYPDCFISVTSY
jgi:hypothetical protein